MERALLCNESGCHNCIMCGCHNLCVQILHWVNLTRDADTKLCECNLTGPGIMLLIHLNVTM